MNGIRSQFEALRFNQKHHLGLGDIRLTVAQQDDICDEVEALRKDAERYRWLRSLSARSLSCGIEINEERLCYEDPAHGKEVRLQWYPYTPVGFYCVEAETLDAAIDEAMRGQE